MNAYEKVVQAYRIGLTAYLIVKYRCNLLIFLIVNDCDLPTLYRIEEEKNFATKSLKRA